MEEILMVYNSEKIVKSMISLVGSALFGYECNINLDEGEFENLYTISKKHSIANIVYYGLQKNKIKLVPETEEQFSKYTYTHLCQYVQQSNKLNKIKNLLNQNNIPYIVLKGSRMRKYYPSADMRTSCDIDILFDAEDSKITEILLANNFQFDVDGGTTINFRVPPMVEVEMHRYLFDNRLDFSDYFDDMFSKSVKASPETSEFIMSEEDFYAYMVAHMAKHFSRYGSGVRTVLDLYVYHKNAPDNFDYSKAKSILKEIGLFDFEQRIYTLISKWFSGEEWTETDLNLTDYIVGAGIYGNRKIVDSLKLIDEEDASVAKQKQNIRFLFPSVSYMSIQYPILKKMPFLLPFYWFVRALRVFTPERKKAFDRQKSLNKIDDEYIKFTRDVMNELHLDANVLK